MLLKIDFEFFSSRHRVMGEAVLCRQGQPCSFLSSALPENIKLIILHTSGSEHIDISSSYGQQHPQLDTAAVPGQPVSCT